MATEVLDQQTVDRANARMAEKGILKPNGAETAPVQRPQAEGQRTEPKPRRTRSDAGKPRQPQQFREIVVKVDLNTEDGKALYTQYFRYLVATGQLERAEDESDWMLKQIGLRAK